MSVTLAAQPIPLNSRRRASGAVGANMNYVQVLGVMERLLIAAKHPDIVSVERYGTSNAPWGPTVETSKTKSITGIMVRHQSTATASLWLAEWPGEQPAELPKVLPAPRQNRAPRLAILAGQLLDAAKPEQFKAWRMVTLPNLGRPDVQAGLPFGLSIVTADNTRVLLRVTATGPTVGQDPDEEPFPDYTIPEEVKTCLSGSSTPKMSPCPPVSAVPAAR
jgi:hypothetical protein